LVEQKTMARSLAGESAIAAPGARSPSGAAREPSGLAGPLRRGRAPGGSRSHGRKRGRGGLGRPRVRVLLAHKRPALVLASVLALLAGGWLWLRHSSLVAVERVRVSGVAGEGAEARAIESALVHAARGMSTLDVNTAALRDAVARFAIVRSVRARAGFPHALQVEVVEQPPVAVLEAGGSRTAVAADGVALGPGLLRGSLPEVHAGEAAAAILPMVGREATGTMLRQELVVLGAAPPALAPLITRAYAGSMGVTVVLADRVRAYFGDATTPHAKWLSLARVLADPSSAGASYVDVRVPERPAAGFPPGTAHAGAGGGEGESSSASDPTTAAALAAGLEAAVAGGIGSSPATSSTSGESAAGAAGGGEGASAQSTGGASESSTPGQGGEGAGALRGEASTAPAQTPAGGGAAPAESSTSGG